MKVYVRSMMRSRDLKLSGSGNIGSGVTTMVQCRMAKEVASET